MDRIVVNSRVGSDGILQVTLPVGAAAADQEVKIIVEPIVSTEQSTAEWQRCILDTAGKWQGELERPDQGEYEQRDPLS